MSTSRVYTVGQVLTAAQMNDLPQGILGKAVVTADSTGFGATEADFITAPAVTIAASNRRIRIAFHCRSMLSTVAGDTFIARIKEGATVLQEAHFVSPTAGGVGMGNSFFAIVDSPTAASHTYKVSWQRAAGTGSGTIGGTSTAPCTIIVEDVGQV